MMLIPIIVILILSKKEKKCGLARKYMEVWAGALKQNTWIEEWCRTHEGFTLYGEVYGWVQDLRYGHGPGKYGFRVFDILPRGRWLEYEGVTGLGLDSSQIVPTLYVGGYNSNLTELADGNSLILGANHIREGIVIKPVVNRQDDTIGRVILKVISNKYLEIA